MKILYIAILTLSLAIQSPLAPARAEGWKPAAAPLMTRWAKDVSPDKVHPEYPRPQMVRTNWLNLNGLWQLALGRPDRDALPAGKELAQKILVPVPVESALSGVMKQADRLWYRRTFQVPEAWKSGRVLLHFQAVDWETTVYVNGKELGTHRGGYDAFSFDITDALKPGGPQELIVKVYDPTSRGNQARGKQIDKPHGIWYTPSTGIWQTVWLEPVPAARVDGLVLTPDLDGSCLRLTVRAVGAGPGHTVRAVARDGAQEVGAMSGKPGSEMKLVIPKDKLRLWSPAKPFLYDLTVTLQQDGTTVDEVGSYFGMRKIELAKDPHGFPAYAFNGEFLFQIGPLVRASGPTDSTRPRPTRPCATTSRWPRNSVSTWPANTSRSSPTAGTTGATSWATWCGRTCPAPTMPRPSRRSSSSAS